MSNKKVKDHYDKHLGNFYSWMSGDFALRVKESEVFFAAHGIYPNSNNIALDLGSGHGIQSAALKNLGFEVIAVDFNEQLLSELKQNIKGEVKVIEADITDFRSYSNITPELVICMGDTLTHLQNIDEVSGLIGNSYKLLSSKGKIIFSFRDMTGELIGGNRFIHVKSDPNRILTCFLEYYRDHIMVNDLLYENKEGKWEMKISSYPKLRLGTVEVLGILKEAGFKTISNESIRGMEYIVSEKE